MLVERNPAEHYARDPSAPLHSFTGPEVGAAVLADPVVWQAAALNTLLRNATPEHIIAAAQEAVEPGRLAVVSSFGTESAILLAAVAAVDPCIPVLLLDTGFLFPETLAYRDLVQQRLGLTDVRAIQPNAEEIAGEDSEGNLHHRDPNACCAVRKVRPLAGALSRFEAWANGRKRFQGGGRAIIPLVEADATRLKFNPLAALSREALGARFRALDLPPHPLERNGFYSIGCVPCTSRTAPGEDARAGRWRGRGKTECGIHNRSS